ncbi:hypothetical protein N7522_002711 [Penicillium canescens]|nr:hypothetical protein N7522_002711 [Penicillium canescens]
MAKNKGRAVVPTLDVDLIWHTHQLSLARYYTLISPSALHAKTNAALLHTSADNTTDGGKNKRKGPHISSHNAVRILAQADPKAMQTKTAQLESCWEGAQRRSHNRSDSRGDCNVHEDLSRKAIYGPYARDPEIHGEIYPCNPTCVNTTAGMVGNCISGTRGVGLAQGACVSGTVSAQTRGKDKSFCAGMAGCGMSL